MRVGKLAEPVQKRSVFRQLNKNQADRCYGTNDIRIGQMIITAADRIPGGTDRLEQMVDNTLTALMVQGACPQQLLVQGILPEDYEEAQLQEDMKRIAKAVRQISEEMERSGRTDSAEYRSAALNQTAALEKAPEIAVLAGQIEVSADVSKPQYLINGIGRCMQAEQLLKPGQELLLTGWIALGGTAMLAQQYESKLQQRYPFSLIDRAKEFEKLTAAARDARAITHFGAAPMHALGQGGIFGALWEMAERAGVGLEVDLKKIPIKQETIELCEYFDINPYEFYSSGSLLVGTDRAEALAAWLHSQGVEASVIGRVTDGKERRIHNGEDCRFLDRPKQDEWFAKLLHS